MSFLLLPFLPHLPANVKERLGKKRGCREQTWLDESVEIDERTDPTGADLSRCGHRASLKGFLPISLTKYLELLD